MGTTTTTSDMEAAQLLLSVAPFFRPVNASIAPQKYQVDKIHLMESQGTETRDRSWSLDTLIEAASMSEPAMSKSEVNPLVDSTRKHKNVLYGAQQAIVDLKPVYGTRSGKILTLDRNSTSKVKIEPHYSTDGGILCPSILPTKLQEVYFKQGRIGVYTKTQRKELLGRFSRKRARRVWFKKIRYGCRKSLACQRIRVKGRFVKTTEKLSAKPT